MPARTFKTILVIGRDHKKIAAKYSEDTKVEEYPFANLAGAAKRRRELLHNYRCLFALTVFGAKLAEELKAEYLKILKMSDAEYFAQLAEGCTIKEDGIAYSTRNPKAHYKYQVMPRETVEGSFMTPFTLKDGSLSYSARKGDIDWAKVHMRNTELHARAWELGIEDAEPINDHERYIKQCVSNQLNYLRLFSSKEEYVNHRSSFWCFAVATDEMYTEVDNLTDDKEWVAQFYERFIEPLSDDAVLTLYEARSLKSITHH